MQFKAHFAQMVFPQILLIQWILLRSPCYEITNNLGPLQFSLKRQMVCESTVKEAFQKLCS